jgi:hypothetical protein
MVAILKFKMAAPNEGTNLIVIGLIEFPENLCRHQYHVSMSLTDRDMVRSNIYGGHFEKRPL